MGDSVPSGLHPHLTLKQRLFSAVKPIIHPFSLFLLKLVLIAKPEDVFQGFGISKSKPFYQKGELP
jgi:hypothetical protein